MRYKVTWYNDKESVLEEFITAKDADEAEAKAYIAHNGTGPAPFLSIEPIGHDRKHTDPKISSSIFYQ